MSYTITSSLKNVREKKYTAIAIHQRSRRSGGEIS
jgi:hypothetical protein